MWQTRQARNFLSGKCSRLKAQVTEVDGTMKETMESVDKPQFTEDQVFLLQRQVSKLHTQAYRAQATSTRIAELKAELKETVTQGKEMFVQG